MNDSQHVLSQKIKIMDSSISYDLTLSFDDVMKDLTCSKSQIARRFKLLIQQKQTILRKQINDTNTNNLKILQQKSIYFEQVNKTNKSLIQQINKKNKQIQTLQRKVNQLQEQIQQLKQTLKKQIHKFKQFQKLTLHDYKRLQQTQIKYKQLINQIQEEKNRKNELQRRINQMKNDKINWSDRIKYLIQNRQKGLKQQYQEQIHKLKDILSFYQLDNKSLKQELQRQKLLFSQNKQKFQLCIQNLLKKYGLSYIPTFKNIKIQTQENGIKKIDTETQINIQCSSCKQINNLARYFQRKHVSIQTNKDPRRFANSQTQTLFNFMQKEQQKQMILNIQQALQIASKQKQIFETKLTEVYKVLDNQPSKMDDLRIIGKLQSKISQKQRTIQMMKNDNLTLKSLNHILHSQLQSLKNQIKQVTQFRVDSLEYKKKTTSLRMFTQQFQHQQTKRAAQEQSNSPPKFSHQKRFAKTVDLQTTRKTFKSSKSRVTAFTPDLKQKSSRQKISNNFNISGSQSFRWQNFQKKLKNPQLFSSSPYVNAVRRQKYKKFSLVKKKKHFQHQPAINFTVAF